MSPNPQRWAKEKLVGRSRCAGLDLTRVVCKKNEERNGEEELGQKGAWKQACREGESSNVSFRLVKGAFWAQGVRAEEDLWKPQL